ncbi:MAG: nuclear transport factor 2 family protein [Ectothiorhodospiraceae bacterium]|nr:nuclear transport factor 2 family protein [Ectothiorhodospiraceae bacterium]
MSPRETVEAFLAALGSRDYETVRALLADNDFSYRSPIAEHASADDFVNHTFMSDGVLQRIEIRKCFVDGDDVCHFLQVHAQISEKITRDVVQWAHVSQGRIDRIEVLFDASLYNSFFPGRG